MLQKTMCTHRHLTTICTSHTHDSVPVGHMHTHMYASAPSYRIRTTRFGSRLSSFRNVPGMFRNVSVRPGRLRTDGPARHPRYHPAICTGHMHAPSEPSGRLRTVRSGFRPKPTNQKILRIFSRLNPLLILLVVKAEGNVSDINVYYMKPRETNPNKF